MYMPVLFDLCRHFGFLILNIALKMVNYSEIETSSKVRIALNPFSENFI